MPEKRSTVKVPAGPKRHPEIPDSVHTAAQKVARNLLNSPPQTQANMVVVEREKRREKAEED